MKNILFTLALLISFSSFGQTIPNFSSEDEIKNWISKNASDDLEGIWIFFNTEVGAYVKAAIIKTDEIVNDNYKFIEIVIEPIGSWTKQWDLENLKFGDVVGEIYTKYSRQLNAPPPPQTSRNFIIVTDDVESEGAYNKYQLRVMFEKSGMLAYATKVYPPFSD